MLICFWMFSFLLIIFDTFRELDGLGASDDLSRYAVRLLKKNFAVFYVENYLRVTQMSRKSKISPKTILL